MEIRDLLIQQQRMNPVKDKWQELYLIFSWTLGTHLCPPSWQSKQLLRMKYIGLTSFFSYFNACTNVKNSAFREPVGSQDFEKGLRDLEITKKVHEKVREIWTCAKLFYTKNS